MCQSGCSGPTTGSHAVQLWHGTVRSSVLPVGFGSQIPQNDFTRAPVSSVL